MYQHAANDSSSQVKGKFAVAPLPGLNGPGVSSLGGHNLGIATNAANKGTAADFIRFLSSDEQAKSNTLATSTAPVNASLYTDADILKAFPQFPILLKSVETAKPRPKVVNYGDATLAIQDGTYAALQQTTSPQEALTTMQSKLQTLIK